MRTADAGTLVMTHPNPSPWPDTEDEWIAEAARGFTGGIVLAFLPSSHASSCFKL